VWAVDARSAVADTPDSVVVLNWRGERHLRAAGYVAQRLLTLPGRTGPRLLVPLSDPRVLRAAVGRRAPKPGLAGRALESLAVLGLEAGLRPPGRTILLGSLDSGPPWPVQAARDAGLALSGGCFAWLGEGDALQRAVLHVLGSDEPGWVVKVGRLPEAAPAFARDAEAARALQHLPAVVSAPVPQRLLQVQVDGLPLSVETRFPGRSLLEVLGADWPVEKRLQLLEPVLAWVHALARHTAVPPERLDGERRRLRERVLPGWRAAGAHPDLVQRVCTVPGVLQHGDLGTWNVVCDAGGGFGVVDWGSVRPHGLPLWDLVYLLADALPVLDGRPRAVEHILDVFLGRSALSHVLFRHLRRAVHELGLPANSVGPLVTLAWLDHARSPGARREQAAGAAVGEVGPVAPQSLLAAAWLRHPDLGPGWSTWR
jgi:hypothetical protein